MANSYSATHKAWDEFERDPEYEFMFASTHPWSHTKYWDATTAKAIRAACENREDLMPDDGPDDDRIAALAERMFLWVIPRRQEDLTMGKKFRGWVMDRIAAES